MVPWADGYITRRAVTIGAHALPPHTYVELEERVSDSIDPDLPDGKWLVSFKVNGTEYSGHLDWDDLRAARLKTKLVPVVAFNPRGGSLLGCGHTSSAWRGSLQGHCEKCGTWVRDQKAQNEYDRYRTTLLADEWPEDDWDEDNKG